MQFWDQPLITIDWPPVDQPIAMRIMHNFCKAMQSSVTAYCQHFLQQLQVHDNIILYLHFLWPNNDNMLYVPSLYRIVGMVKIDHPQKLNTMKISRYTVFSVLA